MNDRKRLAGGPLVPVSLLTGFLGSGKTTVLNKLLTRPELARTVVVINEFGEIGLDHELVESSTEDMVLLKSGCLCCTIRGDLVDTLRGLMARRLSGAIAAFDRVLIETTGLADPAPILHALIYHPYLVLRYRLQAVVTVVDAVNGGATLDAHAEAVRQVAVADRIVLAKQDLAGDTGPLRARLARLNPAAAIEPPEAPADTLLGGLFGLDGKAADVRAWLGAVDEDEHAHGHDPNRHDAAIRAFALASDRPVPRATFEMFLDLLRANHGPKLLRLKGLVALAEDPDRPVVVHGVQHVVHAPVTLPAWPDEDRTSRLVLIVRDLDPSFVARLWDAFLGRPRPDAPDAAALTDNPLAIPGG